MSPSSKKAFSLVELLVTVTILAVLIVAALPYVSDYTSWVRTTSEQRDAQVVASAIARWVEVGGLVNSAWTVSHPNMAWTNGSKATNIVNALANGWTVVPNGSRAPFLAPNTSWTALGGKIKIAFTSARSYTVMARSH